MTDSDPIDTAWRIHAQVVDWTGKVDSKAAFALALEGAVITAAISLSASGRRFSGLGTAGDVLFYPGLVVMVVAMALAGLAVIPRLKVNNTRLSVEANNNFIYFGHLTYFTADQLAKKIQTTELLPVLTQQLVTMSKIAWRKYILVKWSMRCAAVGAILLLVCALVARH